MKYLRQVVLFFLAIGLITGCKSDSIWGLGWTLQSIQGQSVIPETEVVLVLSGDYAEGSGGCNRYMADVEIKDSAIEFHELKSLEIWCDGPDGLNEQEQLYLRILSTVTSFDVDDQALILKNDRGEEVLVFQRGLPLDSVLK